MRKEIQLGGDRKSLDRPAWTSTDLHAYNNKHTFGGKILKDYYIKSMGKV